MIVTIILGLLSVLFAFLAKFKNSQWGLKASFTLIFLFLALRYNFGNDYKAYLGIFVEINAYSEINFFDNTLHVEIGWIFLNWLFSSLGFFTMIAALALINCVIYYRFIKKYVPINYYWFAVFLYIFNPAFMLTHSSAMRQSLAIAIFIFSLDYLFKKDAIRYFICVGLASLVHTSALILLPVYLLNRFNGTINRRKAIIIVSIFASLFVFGKFIGLKLNQFISLSFGKYVNYQGEGVIGIGTGLGVLYLSALLILIVYYERFQDKKTALIFKIAIISFMFIPLSLLIQMIGRTGMYFGPATIIVYPVILMNLKKPLNKMIFLILLLLMTTYGFFQFFYSDIWKDAFGTYQTIFSAPSFY